MVEGGEQAASELYDVCVSTPASPRFRVGAFACAESGVSGYPNQIAPMKCSPAYVTASRMKRRRSQHRAHAVPARLRADGGLHRLGRGAQRARHPLRADACSQRTL